MFRHRFVHLDIKPDNIVLQYGGGAHLEDPAGPCPVAVLVDFGCTRRLDLATMVAELRPEVWSTQQLWGNALHIAPELHQEYTRVRSIGGNGRFNFTKQPTFELGVLAYEICRGRCPIDGYPTHVGYGPDDIEALEGPYPPEFTDLCARMVSCRKALVVLLRRACLLVPPTPPPTPRCKHVALPLPRRKMLTCINVFCWWWLQLHPDPDVRLDIEEAVVALEGMGAALMLVRPGLRAWVATLAFFRNSAATPRNAALLCRNRFPDRSHSIINACTGRGANCTIAICSNTSTSRSNCICA